MKGMLTDELRTVVRGEVLDDVATRVTYSRDASLFEVMPSVVVRPLDSTDIQALVRFVAGKKTEYPDLSLTARSAGTDMSGGPLTESIVVDCTAHLNQIIDVRTDAATAQPGVFYRDFERATLAEGGFLPSYPASRELAAVGGMVSNNAGGEKSLAYGKTDRYVTGLNVVLADGHEYALHRMTPEELDRKRHEQTFEGRLYNGIATLIEQNRDLIDRSRPKVSKNSSGYNLWDVWNGKRFDLTKLIVGSQGTLGIVTEASFRLVPKRPAAGMLVVMLRDLAPLAEIVHAVLQFHPTSFESFDNHTFRLALKFFPSFASRMGFFHFLSLGLRFLPEVWMAVIRGLPKLVLLIEFEEETAAAALEKVHALAREFGRFPVTVREALSDREREKYWLVRRESFTLLREKVKDRQTAPFIDDCVVRPEVLPLFLPKLYEILDRYQLLYTIAGHVGDGNFHIIPLMKLSDEREREKIPRVAAEVFRLVLQHGGSLTAEHNDGLIRSPYLREEFGQEMYTLFERVKQIFDPQHIFNPGKKVGASQQYSFAHLKRG